MKIFLLFVFLVPAMLGLAELLHILKGWLIKPDKPAYRVMLVFIDGENAPQQLLYTAEQYLWQGRKESDRVIAVYSSDDDTDIDYCRSICDKNGMSFCSKQELLEIL